MFSRNELKEIRVEFWTAFGIIMSKNQSACEPKVNWINYKTGVKDLFIRLDIDKSEVSFSIDLQQTDEGIRQLFYEQFTELRQVLQSAFNTEFDWIENHHTSTGNAVSKIRVSQPASLFDKRTWPDAFAYLETCMISWDSFWCDWKDVFIELAR